MTRERERFATEQGKDWGGIKAVKFTIISRHLFTHSSFSVSLSLFLAISVARVGKVSPIWPFLEDLCSICAKLRPRFGIFLFLVKFALLKNSQIWKNIIFVLLPPFRYPLLLLSFFIPYEIVGLYFLRQRCVYTSNELSNLGYFLFSFFLLILPLFLISGLK